MIPLPAPLHADFTKSNEWSGATSFKVGSMAAQICPFSTHATPSGLHPLPASHDSDAGPRTYPSIIVTCDLLSLLSRPILHVTAAWSLHPAGGTDYKGQAPPCVMPQNRSLHSLAADELNPYQSAMTIIAKTLEPFDEDGLIPAIGFGDGELGEGGDVCSCPSPNVSAFSLAPSLIKAMPSLALHSLHIYTLIFRAPLPPAPSLHPPHAYSVKTKDSAVFNFFPAGAPAKGLNDLACRYWEIVPSVQLSGPTSFAPAIHYVRRETWGPAPGSGASCPVHVGI